MTSSFDPPLASTATDCPSPSARPTIAIIGLGRVGSVLGRALHQARYSICAVSSRDPQKAAATASRFGAQATDPVSAARRADLTLLTISDDALASFTVELAAQGAWRAGQYVVHASGVSPASVLAAASAQGAIVGAFHPLAAFANPQTSLPPGITFAVEALAPLHDLLWRIADDLGGQALDLAPGDKTLYHAAAVIASNYTVTLAALATQIFERLGATPEQGLRALLPLMRTTLDNLQQQGLPAALTGPLARGDVGTIRRHVQALDQDVPLVGELYRCLAHGTLPLAQQRGLSQEAAGAIQDTINVPSELLWERGG